MRISSVALISLIVYNYLMSRSVELTRTGPSVHISKPGGEFTVVYENHAVEPYTNLIPSGIKAFFPETAEADYIGEPPLLHLNRLAQRRPRTLRVLKDRRVPVFFADLAFTPPNDVRTLNYDLASIALEATAGAVTIYKTAQKLRVEGSNLISRRRLLGLGGIVASSYLLSPAAALLGRASANITGIGEGATAEFQKLSDIVHPEAFFFHGHLREAALAFKEEWLMQNLFDGGHALTLIGAAHAGIETQFEYDLDQKLAYLERVKSIIKKTVPSEIFYKIVRFDFNGKSWDWTDTIEVPELKALVSE